VYDIAFPIMEVDTVLWADIGRHIAPLDFFHIFRKGKIPLIPIDDDYHICMIVHTKCLRCEPSSQDERRDKEKEKKDFFHKL
jgi:hypothetical protein